MSKLIFKQGKLKFRFPLLPTDHSMTDSRNDTTVTLTNGKEVQLSGGTKAKDLTLTGYFPKDKNHVQGKAYKNIPTGHKCESIIMRMMKQNDGVIQVIWTGRYSGTYKLLEFSRSLMPGGHLSYSLTLKRYKRPKLKQKKKVKSKTKINKKTKKVTKTKTLRGLGRGQSTQVYFVKKGESLSSIAKKITGSSSNYMAIANQNRITNPNSLKPGQRLVIKI